MATNDFVETWKKVHDAATSGEFSLDPEAGTILIVALQRRLSTFEDGIKAVNSIKHVKGLGAFPHTGQALEGKFSMKASGADDALDKRLQEYHDEVEVMIADIQKMMDNFRATDHDNARRTQNAGEHG